MSMAREMRTRSEARMAPYLTAGDWRDRRRALRAPFFMLHSLSRFPQHLARIDLRGTTRRQPCGKRANESQRQGGAGKRQRIACVETVEHRPDVLRGPQAD